MISYYVSILRRRALLVAAVTAIFAPIIFLALTAGEKTYSSEAVIQVGTGDVTDDLVENNRPYDEPERRLATELEVLTGQAVAEDAADRLRAQGWDVDVRDLMENFEASPRGGASAIGVVGTASDPRRAQQLTQAFIDAYIDYRRDLNRAELERVRTDLQQRLAATAAQGDSQRRYDTLAEWLEGVTLRLSVDTSGLELISPASLPEEPTTATTPLVAGVAAVLGALLLGCGEALLVDLVRGSVRTREEAEALVPAPALAEVPRIRGDRRALLTALQEPTHPTNLAARGLRLRLGGSVTHNGTRRIMVVGTEGDGTDTFTVAAALAAAYGRADLRVLLIADGMDSDDLHLFDAARADEPLGLDDPPATTATGIPNVWSTAATAVGQGDVGFLDALDPAERLDTLAQAFDVVVLAMPATPDEAAAVAIGHLVHATVVVCALGRTPAKRLRRLVASLERNGAIVSGMALTTKAPLRQHRSRVDAGERPNRVPVKVA